MPAIEVGERATLRAGDRGLVEYEPGRPEAGAWLGRA